MIRMSNNEARSKETKIWERVKMDIKKEVRKKQDLKKRDRKVVNLLMRVEGE